MCLKRGRLVSSTQSLKLLGGWAICRGKGLEPVRKLFSLVLTRRLQEVMEERGILCGGNFVFTYGRRTTGYVQII